MMIWSRPWPAFRLKPLYVAIDAGQSHTECIAVDAGGSVFATGRAGPSYIQDGSPLVVSAFDDALACLPVEAHAAVRAVLVGATGYEIPGRKEGIAKNLRSRFPAAVLHVAGDAEFVLSGYIGDGPGGVLIAGTGCIATGVWQQRRATVGGHGYLFGDEGGGVGLALRAVRRCLQLAESRSPLPSFTTELCGYFGVDDIRAVPGKLYAGPPLNVGLIAGAAPLIAAAAMDGEPLAVELLRECAHELAALAGRLCLALELPAGAYFPLVLCGGVWRVREVLPAAFEAALSPAIAWDLRSVQTSPALEAARYARTLE